MKERKKTKEIYVGVQVGWVILRGQCLLIGTTNLAALWSSYITSCSVSFFICKMGVLILFHRFVVRMKQPSTCFSWLSWLQGMVSFKELGVIEVGKRNRYLWAEDQRSEPWPSFLQAGQKLSSSIRKDRSDCMGQLHRAEITVSSELFSNLSTRSCRVFAFLLRQISVGWFPLVAIKWHLYLPLKSFL